MDLYLENGSEQFAPRELSIYTEDTRKDLATKWVGEGEYGSAKVQRGDTVIAATDNDAYNTLVATDLAPEFGRDNVYQLTRETSESARYALPPKLGGRTIGAGRDGIRFTGGGLTAGGATYGFSLGGFTVTGAHLLRRAYHQYK